MKRIFVLLGAIVGCQLVGLLSTPFTIASIPTWYATLNKPFFSPPNWIFGPVWTVLYALIGISFFLIWEKGFKKKQAKKAGIFFGIQLVLNFIWSILFFGFQSPLLAFIDIIILLIVIAFTIRAFYKISQNAAYLLVPYLVWVSFATVLNLSILILNK